MEPGPAGVVDGFMKALQDVPLQETPFGIVRQPWWGGPVDELGGVKITKIAVAKDPERVFFVPRKHVHAWAMGFFHLRLECGFVEVSVVCPIREAR